MVVTVVSSSPIFALCALIWPSWRAIIASRASMVVFFDATSFSSTTISASCWRWKCGKRRAFESASGQRGQSGRGGKIASQAGSA